MPAFKGKKRELTAEDYVYSIKRFKDPANKSPYESFIDGIVGLEELKKDAEKSGRMNYDTKVDGLQALDRYTLQIKLKETDYNFGYLMAMPNYSAVAREVIEAYADDTNGHPVGTGPYVLKEWKRSNKIVLEANPDFRGFVWQSEPGSDPRNIEIAAAMKGKKMPQIGRVEISIIEEQQASWLAFQKDELDILYMREQFSQIAIPDNKVSAELAKQGVTLSRITDPDINYTYINTTDPEFGGFSKEKIALRRAILMSFDDAELIRVIRKNQAIDAEYPIPPDVVGHDASYRTSIPYDPALANKLLDYFGFKKGSNGYRTWPNGKSLVWRYSSTPTTRDRELDELWQKSVEKIGIRIHVDKNKFPEELKQERACQLLSRTASWIADYPDGDDFMQLFLRAQQWAEQQCLLPDEGVGPHLRKDAGDAGVTRARPALSTAVADGGSERRNEASRYPGPEHAGPAGGDWLPQASHPARGLDLCRRRQQQEVALKHFYHLGSP